ncbi:FtsX-like permease family protein [Propioniciclava soli]|uniref:ABC3 transporter permease C-terminal domain-containing protein n=1 Tax=Propioniciclava soli TaxID=2775081 RepID=A0ABZ3C3A2_9ACTN|nr:FtsX-like permease family protein [Propioniciclava soli]
MSTLTWTARLGLATRLAGARLRDTGGSGALDLFAVGANAVTAWLSFVVASGTWMFVQRRAQPPAWLTTLDDADAAMVVPTTHVILAAMACALLVWPILSLGGAAARLGARGRARRLASLRLVGMTSGEIVSMSVVESLVQAAAGVLLGALAWTASLPLLGLLTFQNTPVAPAELAMPWWLWLGVVAVLLALAAASTALGLTRVRISPLGVSRQATPPALRAWRLAALAAGVFVIAALGGVMQAPLGALVMGLVFAGMLGIAIGLVNLFSPWLLQLIARLGVRTGSPARLLAMRRIVADPRSAWRNVSSLALLGFLVGMIATIPLGTDAFGGLDSLNEMLLADLRTGAVLTLAIALALGSASTALAQSSDVVDRADELVALDKMGVPPALDATARRHQVALPLLATLVLSLGLGVAAALPLVQSLPRMAVLGPSSVAILALTVVGALALSLLAAESTRPLRRRVLGARVRRND